MNDLQQEAERLNKLAAEGKIEVYERIAFTNFRKYPLESFSKPVKYKWLEQPTQDAR